MPNTKSRLVLCVFAPLKRATSSIDRIQKEVAHKVIAANQLIDRTIGDIAKLSNFVVPRIELKALAVYSSPADISTHLEAEPTELRQNIRICFFSEIQVNTPVSAVTSANDNINFLTIYIQETLGTSLGKYEVGWNLDKGIARSILVISLNDFINILHDVAIDIAMLNSVQFSLEFDSPKQRNQISAIRSQFVASKGGGTRYGSLGRVEHAIAPIASLCWKSASVFNVSKYVDYCDEFLKSILVAKTKPIVLRSINAFQQIFGFRKIAGQLKASKIRKELEQLDSGTYLLAVAEKKPNTIAQRKRIANVLDRGEWKRNTWKIFPFSSYRELALLHPYLTLYKFVYVTGQEG